MLPDVLKRWFHNIGNKHVAAPSFVEFRLKLVMRNSKLALFEDEGLGNYVAKQLHEDVIGKEVEQEVKQVFYRSKAPFWVEIIRKRKIRKMIRSVEREGENKMELVTSPRQIGTPRNDPRRGGDESNYMDRGGNHGYNQGE